MKILDLFSGVGGITVASELAVEGATTVAFCDIDPHARSVTLPRDSHL